MKSRIGWISGWKNIADYIDRSIPTAKRYHYRYSMPVFRLPGKGPACLPSVLDRWLVIFNRLKNEALEKERQDKENESI